MKKFAVSAVLGAASVSAFGSEPVHSTASELETKWHEFKLAFGKEYSDEKEAAYRFAVFVENLAIIEAMPAVVDRSGRYSHITPFADMSQAEFANSGLNAGFAANTIMIKEHQAKAEEAAKQLPYSQDKAVAAVPDSFDWREKGAVTPVKNQQQCGSCWAFATVASIEGSNYVVNNDLVSLSEQQVVDCSPSDHGCQGGLPSNAYKDLISQKMGLEPESALTYTASQHAKCDAVQSKEVVFLAGWQPIATNEDQIASALMQYGPLAIGLNASWLQFYHSGISDPWWCNPSGIDHGVTIVGFGSGSSGWINKSEKKYWVIKNSWGESWGEKGFFRMVRGEGKCGLNKMVTAAEVAKKKSLVEAVPQIYI